MKDIKVDRLKLIDILKGNRDKHKAAFADAEVEYRRLSIQLMKENLNQAENGGEIVKHLAADTPVSYVKEYDRAVGMLEMEIEAFVTISVHDYNQYVMDEWAWSESFASNVSSYNKPKR